MSVLAFWGGGAFWGGAWSARTVRFSIISNRTRRQHEMPHRRNDILEHDLGNMMILITRPRNGDAVLKDVTDRRADAKPLEAVAERVSFAPTVIHIEPDPRTSNAVPYTQVGV